MAEPAPSLRPRDRAATEERILAAVGEVLARDGFGALGVNPIARQAGVDKVLIYRYFGGLPELLRQWGASGRFWPRVDELLPRDAGGDASALASMPAAERYAIFFDRFIDALRARPLTLEILAAETVERNELTAILEAEREQWGADVEALFGGNALRQRPQLRGVTLLLVAGVQYLLVRSRKIRVFSGLDLGSDADWAMLKASVRAMAQAVFAQAGAGQSVQGAAAAPASLPDSAAALPKLSLKVKSSEM